MLAVIGFTHTETVIVWIVLWVTWIGLPLSIAGHIATRIIRATKKPQKR